MEDSKPEKAIKSKKKEKKKSKNIDNKDENNSKGEKKKKTEKKQQKTQNTKKNGQDSEITSTHDGNSDKFAFHELANNQEASALIYDLVKCFTCNFTIPQKEQDILNKVLYEKTLSVILQVLNSCIEKIFNKLLKSGFFLNKNVVKMDAACQTDAFHENS